MKRNIIVIGASMGGFEALQRLVADLPNDMDAAIFIVWHISANSTNVLPQALGRLSTLPVASAMDREPITFGRIYTAPPDRHLMLEKEMIRLTRGPRENRFRPAVDPLFRSAALAYGARVIGVVLSGALDDGTSGLWLIKHFGGIAVVQDPRDAEVPGMPANAIRNVRVDYKVPLSEMGELLGRLVKEESPAQKELSQKDLSLARYEIALALQDGVRTNIKGVGEWTPFTCPECHGVLAAITEGDRVRYRCHTGHAYSVESLLDTISSGIEDCLWSALRSMKEAIALLNHMGDHFAEHNHPRLAAMFFNKAKTQEERLVQLWNTLIHQDNPTAAATPSLGSRD